MPGYNITLQGCISYFTESLGLSFQFSAHAARNTTTIPQLLPPPPPCGVWVPSGGIPDFVRTLYQNILDRDPESQTVIDDWTRHTYIDGLAHTVGGFFTSKEYTAKCMSPEATVEKFYLAVLGRQAEPGGKEHWIGAIRNGASLWEIAEGFVGSLEYRQKVQAGAAPDPILWP